MKKQMKLILALACMSAAFCAVAAIPESIVLQPGEIKVLEFESELKSVDPSSRAITVASQGEGRLRVTGNTPGIYSLTYRILNGQQGKIEVRIAGSENHELTGIKLALERDLRDVIGVDEITINPYLEVVELRGSIIAFPDWSEFRRILVSANERWPDRVISSVRFDPDLKPLNARLQEMLAANIGIADPSVNVVAEMGQIKVILNGSAFSDEDRQIAEDMVVGTLARLGLPEASIINNIRKSNALIEIEFTYFRLSDDIDDRLGVDILNDMGFALTGTGEWETDSRPIYSADLSLNMDDIFNVLKSSDLATASRKQTITVENGRKGSASFGGEQIVPVRNGGNGGTEATRIPFGFIIDVTPTLRGTNNVRLDIQIENSDIELNSTTQDYTKLSSSVQSKLDVPLNGMAVLAVNQTRGAEDGTTGIPFLRRIPIVNLFFGKQTKINKDAYEGFIVVPRIHGGISKAQKRSVSERTDDVLRRIEKKLNAK